MYSKIDFFVVVIIRITSNVIVVGYVIVSETIIVDYFNLIRIVIVIIVVYLLYLIRLGLC